MVSFSLQDAVLALKPVNDTLLVNIAFSLPGNFAYVLNELHLNFTSDKISNFDDSGMLVLSNYAKHARNIDMRIPLPFLTNATGDGLTTTQKGYAGAAGSLWRTPLQAPDNVTAVSGAVRISEINSVASAAGVINFEINFFEFDLEQVLYFPANISLAVTTR